MDRGQAPLCECEYCNEKVKWCLKKKQWNKYVYGHHNKGKNHPSLGKKRPDTSEYMLNGGAAYMSSCNQNPSKPQVELYNLVKQTALYSHAVLNYPSLNYSLDIAIPSQMIAIEYDGSYWHKDKKADAKRQRELETIGWAILRYCDYMPLIEELERDLQQIERNIE